MQSWDDLKARMYKMYRPSQEGSLCAQFLAIKQEGSVAEFNKLFIKYSAPVPQISEEVLEGTYLNGLIPTIRAEVISRRPTGLEDLMEQAQWVEDRNLAIQLAREDLGLEVVKQGGGRA